MLERVNHLTNDPLDAIQVEDERLLIEELECGKGIEVQSDQKIIDNNTLLMMSQEMSEQKTELKRRLTLSGKNKGNTH